MRVLQVVGLMLCMLATSVVAWQKEDHEIFQLRDAIILDLGANTTFYSWIGIPQNANQKELNREYRKRASQLHPDRARASYVARYKKKYGKEPTKGQINKYYKKAEARFQRFSVVGNIMRGEGRERYDYFLKNGFPTWRGTGYYYARYRPGGGTVVVGLFLMMGGVAHYGALLLSHRRHKDFVDRYIKHARKMAWGDASGIAGIPGMNGAAPANGATGFENGDEDGAIALNRKQRRLQEKETKKSGKNPRAAKVAREQGVSAPVDAELTSGPVGAKKKVVAENGKVLIVDSVGNVFIEQQTEEGETVELLLDIDAIERPTIHDTVLVRLPLFLYRKTIGRFVQPAQTKAAELTEDAALLPEEGEEAAIKSATSDSASEEKEARKPKIRKR